ncbi:MAG TPA: alkaline phosphatase family protein [Kofleriaceae bacterium]|nr:alkaline phosphatase family protein [Kofleriaceae bacterium]
MRRALFVLTLLGGLASCHHGGVPASAKTKPKLVVVVVIDQWPSWVFQKQRDLFTGGIGHLVKEGAVVPEAELPYGNPFTAPGHAAISTGATPRVHGIVGNSWWRRDEGRERPAEYDPDAPVFSVGDAYNGATMDAGVSAKMLRVDGIADALRAQTNGAGKSVAISFKPRSAVLIAGRKPDLAIWYDAGAGGMTTSKAYVDTVPAWLQQMAKDSPVNKFFTATWDARDPVMYGEVLDVPDDAKGEASEHGLGARFPHQLATSEHPEHAIVETPFADRVVSRTVAVAIDAMELGRDEVPDLLAISYSAHDYAGHNWGPDSWEVLDDTMRLDAELGELFESLDSRIGKDNWALVVTSDHGATPVVERARIRSARRIPPVEVEQAADKAIAQLQGGGPWVATQTSNTIYMTAKFAALPEAQKNESLDAAVEALKHLPGIAVAGRTDRFSKDCTVEKDIYRVMCNAYVPGESGELYAVATTGSLISEYKAGTGHDAPYDDNRHVPILIKAPGVKAQQGQGTLLQVAPTVAALLGIDPPSAARAPTLFKIQKR